MYGSEADGRIATVDPKEDFAGGARITTVSEFPVALNQMGGSPPDTIKVPIAMRERAIAGVTGHQQVQQRVPDFRRYEIKDHLGNVRTVVADYKNPDPLTTSGTIPTWTYFADIKNISNMYPYGKSYGTNAIYNAVDDYRYGFNGMEKEKNISSDGSMMDFNARVLDTEFPIFGKRDPKESSFPSSSPYNPLMNNPISLIDPDGMAVLPTSIFSANNSLSTFFKKVESNSVFRFVMKSFYRDENHVWIHVQQLKNDKGEPTTYTNVARTQSNFSSDNPVAKFGQHRIIINSDILNSAGKIGVDKTFLLLAFLHEGDHARYFERLRQNNDLSEYPGYKDFVKERGSDGSHHNLMGEFNRDILIEAMKEFDNQTISEGGIIPSYHTEDWYNAMSWYGLTDTKSWQDFKESYPDKASKYIKLIVTQIKENEKGVNE